MKRYTLKCIKEEFCSKPKRFNLKPDTGLKKYNLKPKTKNISSEKIEKIINIIDESNCYTSGCGYPTNKDYSDMCYRLSEEAKNSWKHFVEFNPEKIIKVKFESNFLTLTLESNYVDSNRFIIFEDKNGQINIESKKTREKNISSKIRRESKKKSRGKSKKS